jgi:putative ABC transport system permease protein
VITPGYFETLGIALVRGRLLTDTDGFEGTPSVVISESVANRFWPTGGSCLKRTALFCHSPRNRGAS